MRKNRLSEKVLIILCYMFLSIYSSIVYAAPQVNSITGILSSGETTTISGLSFGDFGGQIVSWDNFDSHQPSEYINNSHALIGPNWTCIYGYSGSYASYDNTHKHSGSLSAYIDWTGKSIRAFGWAGQGPYTQLYISYWRYMTGDYNSSEADNHKQFYLYGNNNQMPQGMPLIPAGSNTWGFYNNVGNASVPYNERNNINTAGWTYNTTANEFQRWEFWVKKNEPYTISNGEIKIWLDGCLGIENYAYRHDYANGKYVDFRLGHMAQGFTESAKAWFDDLYIATTQARVEIGNNIAFNSCTHREIQIPSAWNNTSITITANQGSFNEGNTAYLFVVDADGNVNTNGYPIVIGGSGGDSYPTVNISSPTSATTYTTSQDTIAIAGTASDDDAISSITWSNNRGGSGSANNDSGDWTSWSIDSISLQEDTNAVAVTVKDSANQTFTKTITVTYNSGSNVPIAAGGLGLLAWQATEQIGDTNWKNSVVTYCVRLLIDDSYVKDSGDTVQLTFQGRSSGDYTIKKVSIAERDLNGNQGDVIDPTWTRVTFDGHSTATWDNDIVVVPAGTKKESNPIEFPINSDKDYYVTFKIETPSVYLDPPSGYQELYFPSDDHTSNIDWSSIGYSTAQDYHGFASIVVINQ
jgi:hypothetical protein